MKKLYLTLFLITLCSPILFAQIYVTEAGAGNKDGTSWANAYDNTQLQQAINEAENATVKQVWVAKGAYKPTESLSTTGFLTDETTPVTIRDNAFILKANVEIYGGFAGTEAAIGDRVDIHTTNQTILSGDLNNNNIADIGDAYHVVATRNNDLGFVLDGFTIQYGFADGTASITEGLEVISQNSGGGIYLRASGTGTQYYIRNIRFEHNTAISGGGLYTNSYDGTPTVNIEHSTFSNNIGIGLDIGNGGGALFATAYNDAVAINIVHTNFTGNTHNMYGAAIRLNAGTANVTSTIFENGTATTRGGAIYSTGTSTLNLNICAFRNNNSAAGGHYYIFNGTGNITNTMFENGTSTGNGGAIYSGTDGSLTISKTRFYSNAADGSAGALYLGGSATSITKIDNSVFYNNASKSTTSTTAGGAVYTNPVSSILTITNSTFYANKSATAHGAVSFNNTANVTVNLYNNLFNGNLGNYNFVSGTGGTSADVRIGTTAHQTYTNNIFQNSIASGGTVTGGIPRRNVVNLYVLNTVTPEPLFASTTATDDDFLWPVQGGFSLDKGDNALYTNNVSDVNIATDLLGNPRLSGGAIDLGAIEWSTVLPVTVSSFTANLANNRTQLKWNVGAEDNVNRYEVERSQNGVDFTKAASVLANGSASYQAIDANPQLGVNYYRLKTVDNDGSHSYYGQIVSVKVASLSTGDVNKVYPNPVKDGKVNVLLPGYLTGTYRYRLVSSSGNVVQQGMLNYDGSSANLVLSPSVSKGVYVLHLDNGSHVKLIKQ